VPGRRVGETVVVPTCSLTLRVLEVRGKTVRLGFEAPPQVHIQREEVYLRAKLLRNELESPESTYSPVHANHRTAK
jgi:carbon storage regulator CsrA